MAVSPPPIPQQEALVLIQRLRSGSRTASEELATAYIDWLANRLHGVRTPWPADDHARLTAASNTLISIIKRPEQYDPTTAPLDKYLVMAAGRDLQNLMASELRHHTQQRRGAEAPHLRFVELSRYDREPSAYELDDPAKVVERRETVQEALARARPPVPAPMKERLTVEEERVLSLMRDGVRRNEEFALAMDIGGLSLNEQRAEVKRMKDRLKKRLERASGSHDAT